MGSCGHTGLVMLYCEGVLTVERLHDPTPDMSQRTISIVPSTATLFLDSKSIPNSTFTISASLSFAFCYASTSLKILLTFLPTLWKF